MMKRPLITSTANRLNEPHRSIPLVPSDPERCTNGEERLQTGTLQAKALWQNSEAATSRIQIYTSVANIVQAQNTLSP